MRWDIPECKRCFFCLPLRYGIIIFGYLNLLFACLVLTIESSWMVHRGNGTIDVTLNTMSTYKGVSIYVQAWLPLLLYALEVIFNVILLFGAHTRRIRYIRIYYYYALTTLLASFITFFAVKWQDASFGYNGSLELVVSFIAFVTQIYIILLIRTEMSKRRYNDGTTSYVNQMAYSTYPTNLREDLL